MKEAVILVAGGSGKRMQQAIPKQFLLINKKPVLMYTIECFYLYNNNIDIIVVLPEDQISFWHELCEEHSFTINHQIVTGGSERFYSVRNGLELTQIDSLVAIHDGVRPLVSRETIERCFKTAEKYGNAVPVMPVTESLRKITSDNSIAVPRKEYRSVQTPQVFKQEIVKKAYDVEFTNEFTDDASVVEKQGYKIHLVDGNPENIKITTPIDLDLAELYLR